MKAILVPGVVVLLLAAATVTPAAAHIVDWHDAQAAHAAAVERAEAAADDHAEAVELWDETVDAATLTLEDASGVASAGAGYLATGALTELAAANTALTEALEAEMQEATEAPKADRDGTLEEVRAATAGTQEWSEAEEARVADLSEATDQLAALGKAANDAATAAANSVSTESGSAFGVAPIATAETRAAVEVARDALVAGAANGDELTSLVTSYAAAVEAMFTSQRAEAEAAAREAEESSGGGPVQIVFPPFEPFELTPEELCAGGAYYYCAPWLYDDDYLNGVY